ncbi:asparagine synthase (glutamine-hydrolyzing) [Halobacillus sp. ACCC02827]|uniref:asparagine synthase (glutamine-hydrolyzing) n=1 Tax=Bacillaceae TaxID=186817 RepID=UPI000424F02B|nr:MULTISPECIES: asparagine synthase (glutamine-hydrolyzing) [Bacillaceae]QHT47018.1 asparagine synthase (glutamine-hydrolyzing) [Bacillus sp. SB49]WJE14244.1 asparagine synthase (glutamine-hydrolyzing) [Halobacillus sp. ACCC02827]
MCGITGWVSWTRLLENQEKTLKEMTESITHRGPDADGFWLDGQAAFGHRRLIVVDPEGGLQPMIYEADGNKVALSYNGEIYNFQELREELTVLGHTFQSSSDTEVLLHSYLEWEENCVHHLNGIFAFAIWDERKDQLMLGRDHLGVKPLYFANRDGEIIFGSELKTLFAHPSIEPVIDKNGLSEVFGLGPIRTPGQGVFKDIEEVRAGHYVLFTKDERHTERYWKLESKTHEDDLDETVENIKWYLEDTVNRQLYADRPVVSMLSGGLDSSGLTAIASKQLEKTGNTLHTYSMDFENSDDSFAQDFLRVDKDEPWVKKVAEHAGTNHESIILDAESLVNNLLVPMRARDLPGVGEIETSLYLLFKEMEKDATVALSGESADEVFSGYPWFHKEEFLDADTFPWLLNMQGISGILSDDMKEKLDIPAYQKARYQEALEEVPTLDSETETQAKQRRMSYMFITRFLPFMLDRKDRSSMMTGFEVRVPFCDYRLVEYLWNVPIEMKNVDGIEKGILRRALADYLPEDVRYRKKSAYPSTKDEEYLAGVRNWMLRILDDPDSPVLAFIDTDKIRSIAEEKATDIDANAAKSLFDYLIQINEWMKEYDIKVEL